MKPTLPFDGPTPTKLNLCQQKIFLRGELKLVNTRKLEKQLRLRHDENEVTRQCTGKGPKHKTFSPSMEKDGPNPRRISGIILPLIEKEIALRQIASPENLMKNYFQVTVNFQSLV